MSGERLDSDFTASESSAARHVVVCVNYQECDQGLRDGAQQNKYMPMAINIRVSGPEMHRENYLIEHTIESRTSDFRSSQSGRVSLLLSLACASRGEHLSLRRLLSGGERWLKHGGFLGKGENPNYVGGLTAMYNNIEIDEWGLITLLDKMKELGYACVDTVQFFMKTVRGLVELVTDKVAWDTFNELDLFDVVEVWAVGGEMDESFGEDSSYDGEIDDSDSGSLDDLDYEINIDPNVEYCGEDHHVISKDGQHLNRVHVKLHCTVCKKEGHNRRKCPLNPTVSNRQNNPRRKSTTKKQGPTCSSASQVDPTSTQAAPVDLTSSQAPPVDQTSIEAPPVDQTSSPSDAQPAGMEDDISDQLLADLDIDAFVSNLIDDSGIGSGQQQQQDGDEDTQAAMDDDNATKRPTPCHKAKKIKVSKSKHVVNGRKYGTRARFAALKAKFPPTSADSPCNVD
nr:uncharacterized protein LOC109154045 [Ipomoea batatas]